MQKHITEIYCDICNDKFEAYETYSRNTGPNSVFDSISTIYSKTAPSLILKRLEVVDSEDYSEICPKCFKAIEDAMIGRYLANNPEAVSINSDKD